MAKRKKNINDELKRKFKTPSEFYRWLADAVSTMGLGGKGLFQLWAREGIERTGREPGASDLRKLRAEIARYSDSREFTRYLRKLAAQMKKLNVQWPPDDKPSAR